MTKLRNLEAFDSLETKGRRYPLKNEHWLINSSLDPFVRDARHITFSKAFRRLNTKAQVLRAPENPHIRTRKSHTEEVSEITDIIAENLGLNRYLCRAIALGHDIGHTPYGHLGESVLSELSGKSFKHNIFSVVLAQEIEGRGKGLDLSYETLQGMLYHSMKNAPKKSGEERLGEYDVVMHADKIAYIFADVNDAIRYNLIEESRLPKELWDLGDKQISRQNTCMEALINESKEKGKVSFSEGEIFEKFNKLKSFMYEEVYYKIDDSLARKLLEKTYRIIEREFPEINPTIGVALLTDTEVNDIGKMILNSQEPTRENFSQFSISEIAPYIAGKNIDFSKADLSWAKKNL